MIGIQDTFELNARRAPHQDRVADRITGVQKGRPQEGRAVGVPAPQPNPLKRYTRTAFAAFPGDLAHAHRQSLKQVAQPTAA